SEVRKEATGYGCVYFAENMLNHIDDSLRGKTCVISGAGNVAVYTAEKIIEMGGKVVTLSDSGGFFHDPDGLNDEKLEFVKDLKFNRRGRIREYAEKYNCKFVENEGPWSVPCDAAFPSATQNEINGSNAKTLVDNGCQMVVEGANMPSEAEAAHRFLSAGILYAPSKAANAGGVAVSGLEQSQNALRISWSHEEVNQKLRSIMDQIHKQCVKWGDEGESVNYVKGANIAGFVKVADAMLSYGVV
ncbi:MAG: glutamate dehydrogenase, partial [Phycisphaeraceae bacterium]|nr:glutamate dehydrogenase [Phycisphaeraceae bacterium]